MAPPSDYRKRLQEDLESLIEELELSVLQKHFLRSRWLDQVLWLGARADRCRKWHYFLRLAAIVGGVMVPALVSLNVNDGTVGRVIRGITFALSLVVAISVAVEGFLRFGERWRHYRQTEEALKIAGWEFFQLSGPYLSYGGHSQAYPSFAENVEAVLKREVEEYVTRVVREKETKNA